jgi:hypothetical protein
MGRQEEGVRSLTKLPLARAKVGGGYLHKERVAALNPIGTPKRSEVNLCEYSKPGRPARWADLPAEILELVIKMDGHSITTVTVLSQVCNSWRTSLTSRYGFWNCLEFGTLSVKAMEPAKQIPWILKKV